MIGSALINLRRDGALYRRFVIMQLRAQWQYKTNVIVDIVTYCLVTLLESMTIFLFFGRFPTMLGWSAGQVAFLTAIISISFGCSELIGEGIGDFADMIRLGTFDRLLLRPVGVFTQVIGSNFRLRRLGRLTQGSILLVISQYLLPTLHWNIARLLLVPVAIMSGATTFIAISLLGATLCFWTIETTELTNILTYGGREMLSYPFDIYPRGMQWIFLFIIPLATTMYLPVCIILDHPLPFGMPESMVLLAPLVAALFAVVAWLMWGIGIQHYQSTGN
jgi:ABC-2 type transport system permease protein